MSDYVKMTIKISKEDLKGYLLEYLTEEEIENTNLQSEATDVINGILLLNILINNLSNLLLKF